ncbi:MAG: Lpg1974 family pore-forming outer membrane protein [Ferrovibrio sp.]|uniref:Lpg1974 family pore-forming outer membrane protein n=1 Tax=Ferrovibrio sp. TaxID=1917215 RepID=UPI00391B5B6E
MPFRRIAAILLIGGVSLAASIPAMVPKAMAQNDARYEQLMRMLENQQRRIEDLEARLNAQQAVPAGARQFAAASPAPTTAMPGSLAQMGQGMAGHGMAGMPPMAAAPAVRPREISLSLQPLLLKPMSDSFRFLSGDANADTQTATVDHGFGPGLEGGVLYAPAGRRFAVALTGRHLSTDSDASTRLRDTALFDAGFGGPAGTAGETVVARSEVETLQFDLDLRSRPRGERPALFAGLRYAELNRDLDIRNNVDAVSLNQAHFRGVGPRVGADGRVSLGSGFYIDGGVAGSLLLGTGEVGSQTNNNGTTPNLFYRAENHRAVPVLDGRIALGWDVIEDAGGLDALGIELGLRAQHWMGLQDFVFSTDTLVGAANIGSTDMTFAGPYLSVKARW